MRAKRVEELQQQLEKMTPEEERAYWDAQDPFRQGKAAKIHHPKPPSDRMSYFALRLSGKDIGRLAELAERRGRKPSELARALIGEGLEQAEGHPDLGERIAALERELASIRRQLAALQEKVPAAAN